MFTFCLSSQLQSAIDSMSQADSRASSESEDGMDVEVDPQQVDIMAAIENEPDSQPLDTSVLSQAAAGSSQASYVIGKGKGRRKGKDTNAATAATADTQVLSNTDRIQGQITDILASGTSTESTAWGNFMGHVSSRIDPQYLMVYYRECIDHAMTYVDRTRALVQPPPPQQPPLQQQQFEPNFQSFQNVPRFQQQQQQQQQQQPHVPSYTDLIGPGGSGYLTNPSDNINWSTLVPTAGQPPRPQSTPNMTNTSLPRLSDLSAMMSPDPHTLHSSEQQDSPSTSQAQQSHPGDSQQS